MPRIINYTAGTHDAGKKIYTFLRYTQGYSARLVRCLKNTPDGILLNGSFARTIDLLSEGDTLTVTIPDDTAGAQPVEAELDIVYEDEDIIILNKSPFMAMHPTHNHQGDTLANALSAYLLSQGKPCTFRAVGRLDKGTAGLTVCALTPLSACKLNGKIKKTYYAAVKGVPGKEGTVDVPLYRPDPGKTLRACSYEKGTESAVTHWTTLDTAGGCSLVRLRLETGRTHQIRVHMAYAGHELAGDNMYGSFMPELGHQLLFCGECEFTHPVSGEEIKIKLNLPPEFTALGFKERY